MVDRTLKFSYYYYYLLSRHTFCTILVLADPPTESPQITRHAAGGELLRTGDTVTCTVTGSRPTVDEVIFYCTDPQLDGHPGDVSATSVSSTITVDSARATEDNMTCFCSAVWKPNEDFYRLASEATYSIEREIFAVSTTVHLVFGVFEHNRHRQSYEPVSDNDVVFVTYPCII